MQTWYHIARTPAGIYVHRLSPTQEAERAAALRAADPDLTAAEAAEEARSDVLDAIRDSLGFPPRGRWVHRDGWDSSVSMGEPHPRDIMAVRVNEDIDTLPDLPPVPVYSQGSMTRPSS